MNPMNSMRPLTIAGISVAVVCAALIGVRMTKSHPSSDQADGAAKMQGKQAPFRNVVVELTFQSRSLDDGVETLSATGHRTEYIDVAGGRRREDYSSNNTIMGGQLPSQQSLTWIFDGAHFYLMVDKGDKHVNRVAEIHEKFDSPIWADAPVDELKMPGVTIGTEEFLGRPCKVYTVSTALVTKKWWVWNGVTLRSESHQEIQNSISDTSEEAVRVDENADIDPGLFIAPSDVTFEPAKPTPAKQMGQRKTAPWVRKGPEIELFWL